VTDVRPRRGDGDVWFVVIGPKSHLAKARAFGAAGRASGGL
jgi:hypothetical protein